MLARTMVRIAAIIAFVATFSQSARAETFSGSNVDSRVLVGMKVNSEGVQTLMPEGWDAISWPSGPLKGANLLVTLIDGILEMDPEGNPLDPPSRKAVVLVGLGKEGDVVRGYVLHIMTDVAERDPYSVASPAKIERARTVSDPSDGPRTVADSWTVLPEGGGTMKITLDYAAGNRSWGTGEAFPYSAADPSFSRIYRYDQMVDLVVSEGLGKPASGTYSVTSDVAQLAALFDGTEQIMAIMDVPVYVRKVSLP